MAQQAWQQQQGALATATPEDPLVTKKRNMLSKLLDIQSGAAGPIDVRNLPDDVGISLYEQAKKTHDAGRVGRGLGTAGAGANPTYIAALQKEEDASREQFASGGLEDYVSGLFADANQQALGVGESESARKERLAAIAAGIYGTQAKYSHTPSFLEQLALQAAGGAGTAIAGFASDERLKDNIEPISSKLEQLSGVTWDWKPEAEESLPAEEKSNVGVVAQDVEREFPALVDNRKGYKRVNVGALAALAIEALKHERRKAA